MAIAKICCVDGCDKPVKAKMLCAAHYRKLQKFGDHAAGASRPSSDAPRRVCSVEGCGRPHNARGLCASHYARVRRDGIVAAHDPIKGKVQGVPYRDPNGYVVFTDRTHPAADNNGRVLEHRAVMMAKLGRKLLPGENVHHINGVKDDNRPENLELWVTSQPSGQRTSDLVAWAKEILERYGGDHAEGVSV